MRGSDSNGGPGSLLRLLQLKFLRFAAVGAVNGLIYAVATAVYVSGFGLADKLASAIGYLTVLPIAFVAHRSYTFLSRGKIQRELFRFFLTHGTSLLVSVVAMGLAVDYLGLHYSFGIFGAIILVPIVTFFVMDNWVFAHQLAGYGDKKKT